MKIPVLSSPRVRNIIVADDDTDDQLLLKEVIDTHILAPHVTAVSDGSQLMHIIAGGFIPDLVLLDLNMPNKNGIDCLREIRSMLNLQQLPLVILSTSRDPHDIEECYRNGAQLFFSKPHSFGSLKSLVNYILDIDWPNFPASIAQKDYLNLALNGIPSR